MRRRAWWWIGGACALVGLVGFVKRQNEVQLSAAVVTINKGPTIESYLKKPGVSYVQTYFRFDDQLGEDVILGVDQEFVEGVNSPKYIKGGDWMAIVGVQRNGTVWIGGGTDDTMKGNPSSGRNWKFLSLGAALKPNTWYRMYTEADFSTRHFKTFTLDGPGVKKTFDISDVLVDYPNMLPFDERMMTYFVYSIRVRPLMKGGGHAVVYFDDVEGGIADEHGKLVPIYRDSFENQDKVEKQPITLPLIKLGGYKQSHWYLEREESVFHIDEVPFARSGKKVGVADAALK